VPRSQGLKRPVKPSKETINKTKQAPTVIRVNTTSSQRSLIHQPSNSTLASTLRDTLAAPQQQQGSSKAPNNSKPSQPSLQAKTSIQSFKSSVSSAGRPRALELAARKKEQEQREAQKKREAKLDISRKRAAQQEEERRLEQQRKAEEDRRREEERKNKAAQAAQAKEAQRQAAIEKAKQTRAPPPAARPQPNGLPDSGSGALADNGLASGQPPRPPSRLGSLMHPDSSSAGGRPVNTLVSNAAAAAKMATKRPLPADASEEGSRQQQSQRQSQQQRNGPSFQSKEAKRMRMSEEFDEDIASADHGQWSMQGPPVRPSGGFKKVYCDVLRMCTYFCTMVRWLVCPDADKICIISGHALQILVCQRLF